MVYRASCTSRCTPTSKRERAVGAAAGWSVTMVGGSG